jgi:hypothetical protein
MAPATFSHIRYKIASRPISLTGPATLTATDKRNDNETDTDYGTDDDLDAQGPGTPEEKEETTANDAPVEQVMTEASEQQPLKPYTVCAGKFPDSVEDIQQVLRRYWQISPWLSSLSTSGDALHVFFPVTIYHQLAEMYASWAGSLHFRVLTKSASSWIDSVHFMPYSELRFFNSQLVDMGYGKPFLPPASSLKTDFSAATFLSGTNYWTTNAGVTASQHPHEVLSTMGGMSVIDVSIPFNTIYEKLPTPVMTATSVSTKTAARNISTQSGISPYIGILSFCIRNKSLNLTTRNDFEIYQSVGDDFRLMDYCGAIFEFAPYTDTTTGVSANFGLNNSVEGFRRL